MQVRVDLRLWSEAEGAIGRALQVVLSMEVLMERAQPC
jgi:hypothetical protein